MTLYQLERHPLVERDIARIVRFLLTYTTPQSVEAKLVQMDTDVNMLRENPFRGTRHEDIVPGLRAIPSVGKGVIAFQVIPDRHLVRILAISWAGGNWQGWTASRV